ncbi:type II secretion system F family protein [bacterium]|nr:type II secretion system F family protein [bacterium]
MGVFLYKYKTKTGKKRSGEVTAESLDEARARFNRPNIFQETVKVQEKTVLNAGINLPNFDVVTTHDISIFTRQFAVLLDASIDLTKSFDILAREMENQKFKKILMEIKSKVESGVPLSQALGSFPKLFDSLFTNMVSAGESSGKLPLVFTRLSEYIEKAEQIKGKVKAAMTYPTVISIVTVVMVWFMLTKVIPTFETMFADMNAKLPGPTQLLINISHYLQKSGWVIILIVGAFIALHITLTRKSKKYIWFLNFLALKAPILGGLTKKTAIARFARTLSTLLDSGVHLPEALYISSKTTGNLLYEEAILEAQDAVTSGQTLTTPLKEAKIFPGMVLQMIDAGQESGKTSVLLAKVADFYEEEVDTAVEGLMSALEPLIMVVIGGILGFIIVAMFMPILTMSSAM